MDRFDRIFQSLSEVPCSPFLPKPRIRFLQEFLDSRGIKWQQNNVSIIVHIEAPKKNAPKLILLSHIDHPGGLINGNKKGIFFGSVEPDRLEKILKQSGISITIYNPEGEKLGLGKITQIYGKYKHLFKVESSFSIPQNSFAQWNIPYFKKTKTMYKVYAADNDLPTAVLLSFIDKKLKSEFDLYYVFTFYEEDRQVSSFELAKRNMLDISPQDFILNLESKEIDNLPHPYQFIKKVTYKDGNVLHSSETAHIYGFQNPLPNKMETVVKEVVKHKKIPMQFGVIKGSTDARAFSYFNRTPNICTLSQPNQYKHNVGKNGEIVTEEILLKDAKNFIKIVENVVSYKRENLLSLDQANNFTKKMKVNDKITDLAFLKDKYLVNERLRIAFRDVIARKHYFPENAMEYILDFVYKILSYMRYYSLRSK